MGMANPGEHQVCSSRCKAPVPADLKLVGLCVSHFTLNIERTCSEMHRQIVLDLITAERQTEVANYIGECALLIARLATNLCLSDDLKRRILTTFLALMNLRETLEHATSRLTPHLRSPESSVTPAPAVGANYVKPRQCGTPFLSAGAAPENTHDQY
jgi:hypothetical protein